jgi:hypothetical protein
MESIYNIKGNHPVLKRVDLIVNDKDNLHQKIDELLLAGYEVTIEQQPTEQIDTFLLSSRNQQNKVKSMGDILRSALKALKE